MGDIFRHVLAVLPAFLLACLAVAALPGSSTALFLHRTVRDGRAAGWNTSWARPWSRSASHPAAACSVSDHKSLFGLADLTLGAALVLIRLVHLYMVRVFVRLVLKPRNDAVMGANAQFRVHVRVSARHRRPDPYPRPLATTAARKTNMTVMAC